MRFSTALLATAFAAIAAAQNQFTMTTVPDSISAGTSFNITWAPSTPGTISLILVQADAPGSKNVHPVATIAGNIANSGAFVWVPENTIPKGSGYALEIVSDSSPATINYSGQFAIDSTTTAAPSSASASLTSAASAASTASSASGSSSSGASSATDSSTGASRSTAAGNSTSRATATTTRPAGTTASAASASASSTNAGAAETARAGMGIAAILGVAMLAL